MKNKINPKKWIEVYPVGTKEGDEEAKFFRALARNPKFDWRSTAAISKESNLPKKRVEEIILKYYKLGMVFQNPKNEDHWGYWERVPHMLPEKKESICESDKNKRIEKAKKKS
jgi:hypothetical protein